MITLKRVYEPASPEDGARILVERLWPRGITKAALALEAWSKDVAPSDALRRWFAHNPAKWAGFHRRLLHRVGQEPLAWNSLLQASRRGRLTLLYSSHDTEHNNAVALKDYLDAQASPRSRRRR